jgi:hypothetical protein
MPLRRICKSGDSGDHGECPAVYLEKRPLLEYPGVAQLPA